jgi:hypothetical protein
MSKTEDASKKKVAKNVAIEELTEFLKKYKSKEFRRGLMTHEKIEEDYIDVIEAIEDGNLIFEKGKPKYKLREPLFKDAEDKSLMVTDVNFRSRIKEADRALIMDGLDLEKKRGTYVLKTLSYITQLSMVEVKELEKEDFDVLNQICSVF